jgi:hypothetical protein
MPHADFADDFEQASPFASQVVRTLKSGVVEAGKNVLPGFFAIIQKAALGMFLSEVGCKRINGGLGNAPSPSLFLRPAPPAGVHPATRDENLRLGA